MTIKLIPSEEVYDASAIEEIDENEIKKRFEFVIDFFQKSNPNPTSELKYNNPYELLVATILSAQTTDKRVNMVTPELFRKYPTPERLATASSEDIYPFISSVTYPGNKSDYLTNMAKKLVQKYNGKIPEDVDELQTLPGVGRKTAHILGAVLYNKPVLAVDTHVFRVAERIGLTTGVKKPLDSEEQLIRYLPKEVIPKFNFWLVLHGRYVCTAKNPKCEECGIKEICRYCNAFVKIS
jgi:endonuclease-3